MRATLCPDFVACSLQPTKADMRSRSDQERDSDGESPAHGSPPLRVSYDTSNLEKLYCSCARAGHMLLSCQSATSYCVVLVGKLTR